jgi:hypothetical protein
VKIGVVIAICWSTQVIAQVVDASCYSATIKPGVVCPGESTDPATAANNSSKYAWGLFAEINQPAFPGNKVDTRRVWETWKSADDNSDADDAIYLDDGSAPRPWNVQARSAVGPKVLVPIRQLELMQQQMKGASGAFTPFFIANDPLAEEVRTNRPAFNFILANTLYNQQGQYQYASVHLGFDFPVASKEVKAVWLEATPDIKPADYYQATVGGKTYVLVSMHVITKDLPFWFWSTFVHKDQNKDPDTGYVAPLDAQAPSDSLRGTPFANYRLVAELAQGPNGRLTPTGVGAQIDWITRVGEPTVMGNPHIEKKFEKQSSCITCHAHASIGRDSSGSLNYNGFPTKIGAVDPKDMDKNGVTFYPLDFLWSLRNANSKTK